MHALTSLGLGAALAAGLGAGAQAQVVNGDFASGLAGWRTFGDVVAQGDAAAGTARMLLTTAGLEPDEFDGVGRAVGPFNLSGTAALEVGVPGGLEAATGFALGAFDPPGGFAVEGSLARQTFDAAAGQTLGFAWNFATRDAFADYAFVAIDGRLTRLAGAADAVLPGSGDDLRQTGAQAFSHTFAAGGSHTLAFGVVDVGDSAVRSSLAVAQVRISAIPEPQTAVLLLAGLALLAGTRSRRR